MGELSDLFEKQYLLQKKIGVELAGLGDEQREHWTKENILAMHAELSELLDWTNWKHWKKTRVVYDEIRMKKIQFEIIDLLHFWLNLCIIWNLTPQNMIDVYNEKNKINHDRQNINY